MIGLEIVDLFPEDQRPHILAEKFDDIEGIGEAWAILGEPALGHSFGQLCMHLFNAANSASIKLYFGSKLEKAGNRPYLSTSPCPTRCPKVSSRENAASDD